MKKLISLLIICTILVSFCEGICVSASVTREVCSGIFESENNRSETLELKEEIIFCDATMEEDFEDDSLIVIFKNSKSRDLNLYTSKSFPEINVASVNELTTCTKKRITNQRNKTSHEKINIKNEILSSCDEMYVDEDRFHQIVKIELKTKSKDNVLKCIKKLEARDDVLMVIPNYIYKSASISNDPEYPNDSDWALQRIHLPQAWNISTNTSTVNVGIIDSGIQGDHEDLTNVVNRDLSEDFTGGNSPLTDEYGHGTVVAGVIGAESNNAMGIAGTCQSTSLVSLKAGVINSKGECTISLGRLTSAIDYAVENNIPILNYSYYGEDEHNNELKIILENYNGIFICASGNKYQDITNSTVSKFEYNKENTIVVAGSDEDDKLYSYITVKGDLVGSNYSATKVHLAAPGFKIGTTSATSQSGYEIAYGTSIATPFVTGVAALLKSKYPEMSAETIKYYIENGVDKIDALEDKVATGGRLNAYKALSGVKTFKVRYDANGGVGTMPDSTIIYNNVTRLSTNQFTYSGADFAGWCAYRQSDNKWLYTNGTTNKWFTEGTETTGYYKYTYRDRQTLAKTTSVNNDVIVMQAQWNYKITVNFSANTGSGTMSGMTVDFTKSTPLKSNSFTKSGYRFDHWYIKNSAGETFCYSGNITDWYMLADLPDGYYREKLSNGTSINKNIITELKNGDAITLYAYWEPLNASLGDVDKSGYIGSNDVTLIQNYLAGSITLTSEQKIIADVNYSNSVTVKDATAIQKYIRHEIRYFVD